VLGCASGKDRAPPAAEQAEEAALQETAELCSAGVSLGAHDRDAVTRRLALQTMILAAGVTPFDETAGEIARIHADAQKDCYGQVLPALSGEAGVDAVAILREARLSCEADGMPPASAALAQCIHARKLERFTRRGVPDSPHERETLDRLLRVGGGAPLSSDERATYCRTRELNGSGSPLCR